MKLVDEAELRLIICLVQIYNYLMDLYPDPPCPLDHANAFQLLTSVILSAQVRFCHRNASKTWLEVRSFWYFSGHIRKQECLHAVDRQEGE